MNANLIKAEGVAIATSRNLRALYRQVEEIERLIRNDANDRGTDEMQGEFEDLLALKKAVDEGEGFLDRLINELYVKSRS